VVDGFFLRGTLGFQHLDVGNAAENAIRIGVQTIQL
jgi:hypothetical protein